MAVLDLIFLQMPRHLGHFRYYGGNRVAIAADRQIHTAKDVRKLDAVGSGERSFQDWLGYLKPDEVVIGVRGVVPLSDLIDIKTKFHLRVCGWLLIVSDD